MWSLFNGRAPRRPTAAWLAGALLFLGSMAQEVRASQITWASNAFANNLQSGGLPLDSSFVFFLGTFAPGFVPTAANTSQWAARWITLEASAYNPVSGRFAESTDYATNSAPFLTGVRGYIWGTNGKCGAGEWILLSNSSWTFPVGAGGPGAPTVTWSASQANQVIIGTLGAGDVHLRTAAAGAAVPPVLSPTLWRQMVFTSADLSDDTISGWSADPDRDGASNLQEYATGSPPKSATRAFPILTPVAGANAGFSLTLARDCRSSVLWSAQESPDLTFWTPASPDVVQEPLNASGFRLTVPPAGQSPRFVRFLLSLPPG